jgi:hypothetical protein
MHGQPHIRYPHWITMHGQPYIRYPHWITMHGQPHIRLTSLVSWELETNYIYKSYRFQGSEAEKSTVHSPTLRCNLPPPVTPTLEAASSSEISVFFCQRTRRPFPTDDFVVWPLWRPWISSFLPQFMDLWAQNCQLTATSVGEANSCSAGQWIFCFRKSKIPVGTFTDVCMGVIHAIHILQ